MFSATYALTRFRIVFALPLAYRRWLGRGFRRLDAARLAVKYLND